MPVSPTKLQDSVSCAHSSSPDTHWHPLSVCVKTAWGRDIRAHLGKGGGRRTQMVLEGGEDGWQVEAWTPGPYSQRRQEVRGFWAQVRGLGWSHILQLKAVSRASWDWELGVRAARVQILVLPLTDSFLPFCFLICGLGWYYPPWHRARGFEFSTVIIIVGRARVDLLSICLPSQGWKD